VNLIRPTPAPVAPVGPVVTAPAPVAPGVPAPAPVVGPRTPGDGPDNCIVIERLFDAPCFQSPADGRWYIIRGTI